MAELHETEFRIQAILDSAADAIITIDGRGRIEAFNRAAEKMFGYARQELLGQNIALLMPEPFRKEHDSYLSRYAKSREARLIGTTREFSAQRRNGSIFPITLSIGEIPDLGLYTATIHELSERKALQRQILSVASAEQQRIGQELHDNIQQELTGLGLLAANLADMLHETGGDAAKLASKVAAGIAETNYHVRLLARDLISVRVQADGLMSALRALSENIDAIEGTSCTFECPEPVAVPDDTTATELYRIAQEAVTNVLKHARASHISICLIQTGDNLRLEVRDNGMGIDVKRKVAPEPGKGLKIMRHRCEVIGGTFEISDSRAGGTTIVCTVPQLRH